jgi:Ca-activated chloride channel family protein
VKGEGLEIYILFDTSKSMLTQDVLPSRLERGKYLVSELLKSLEGDRVGFIPFSSSAYIQMPLTDDYDMANMFMDVMDTDMISGGGSNVAKAIDLAIESFDSQSESDQVILVITDGEEHDDKALDLLSDIKSNKTKIFTVGVGTTLGGLIPEYDESGSNKTGYKKDEEGHAITSKLDETLLKTLAQDTGGSYYRTSNDFQEVNKIIEDMNQLNKAAYEVKKVKEYVQLYPYFLCLAMICILIGLFLPERRLSNE